MILEKLKEIIADHSGEEAVKKCLIRQLFVLRVGVR